MTVLRSINPATGVELANYESTPIEAIGPMVERLRAGQTAWAAASWRSRVERLLRLERQLAGMAGEWVEAIVREIGKPRVEALVEVCTTLDAIRWTLKHGKKVLRARRAGAGVQRLILMGDAQIQWRPIGVVGLIGTWNYPLLLNLAPLVQALAAGNVVIWKPSELALGVGALMDRMFREAGLDNELAATVVGGADVGEALLVSGIGKAVFTGGIPAGRAVLARLGSLGLAGVAELSGFDAAIVLPSAPLKSTAAALAWSAFVGAGQTCVATKRVYVVGDPEPWTRALAEHARALRLGNPGNGEVDMGPLISVEARDRFDARIRAAVAAGGRVVWGGQIRPGEGAFYEATVLSADHDDGPERALAGVFGPVVVVRGVADSESAVKATNASEFGLAGSVWGRGGRELRAIAARLETGMVTINDAVTPAGHAAAPFGGIKASGFGRTRGAMGLLEFVEPQAVHQRGVGGLRPQLFPYSQRIEKMLEIYLRLLHRARP